MKDEQILKMSIKKAGPYLDPLLRRRFVTQGEAFYASANGLTFAVSWNNASGKLRQIIATQFRENGAIVVFPSFASVFQVPQIGHVIEYVDAYITNGFHSGDLRPYRDKKNRV